MPTEIFRSKVDAWLVLVFVAAALLAIAGVSAAIHTGEMSFVAALASVLVAAGIPLWLFATTRYELSSEALVVRSGPFRWSVPLVEVKSVTPTRNPLASPALSLDRLRIEYGRGQAIMISPRDKESFLRSLEARRKIVK